MPHIVTNRRAATVTAPLVLVLACLGLAACGSSSGGHATSSQTGNAAAPTAIGTPTTGSATTATTPASAPSPSTATEGATPAANKRRRLIALRMASCMRNNGVKLPPPGPEGYIRLNGSAAGTAKFKAALTKCRPVLEETPKSASSPK